MPGSSPPTAKQLRRRCAERFDILWDRTLAEGEKPDDLLDDRTGVDAAIAQVFDGGFAEAAESSTHTIEELVFTSPVEAWFRYSIDSINGHFGPRWGAANLIDGVWVFPRALVCQDLGLAGGSCDPWAEQIYPPSWYERYGAPYGECYQNEDGTEVCETFAGDAIPIPTTTVPAQP